MEKTQRRQLNKRFCLGLLIQLLVVAVLLIKAIIGASHPSTVEAWASADFGELQDAEDGATQSAYSPAVTLRSGVYRVTLQYETPDDQTNVWSVAAVDGSGVSADGLLANTCMLYSGLTQTDMYVYATETVDVQVCVTNVTGSSVAVHSAEISATVLGTTMWLTGLLILFALMDLLYLWGPKTTEQKQTVFALAVITILASLPILNGYTIAGADTIYHMLRIEGVKDGLLSGQFPVRMQPNWLQGYGYATGIFYCDTFLYFPALLRIVGFPVTWVYLFYKLLINIASVCTSYLCFSRMFRSRMAGILCSGLYTLTIYRLLILYLKDHLGQTTAMALLPVLVYAIWRLLEEDADTKEYRRSWILLTIGETLLIQCHVLTCELALGFGLLVFLVQIRRVLRLQTLMALAKSTLATLLLNAWFLVPFLQYYAGEMLNITSDDLYTRTIQSEGASIPMLLGLVQFAGHRDNTIDRGLTGAMPFTLGIALLIGVVVLVWLLLRGARSKQLCVAIFGAVFGLLALWMASAYFPWDALHGVGGILTRLVSALQYPTRLLEVSTVFLCMTAGGVLAHLEKHERRNEYFLYGGITAAALVIASGLFLDGLMETSPLYKIYDAHSMGNAYLSGREYLPVGTDENALRAGTYAAGENVTITAVDKDDLTVHMAVQNTGTAESYVEVPLLYYSGYRAVSENGEVLALTYGDNNVIRVILPAGFDDTVTVRFISPLSWRVAEVISYLAWAGLIVLLALKYRAFKEQENEKTLQENV